MKRLASYAPLGAVCLIAAWSSGARAAGPDSVAAPASPQAIYGGTEVEECGWPTTVYLETDVPGSAAISPCTGTLVHPQVVVFAAHCMYFVDGQSPDAVTFGETNDHSLGSDPPSGKNSRHRGRMWPRRWRPGRFVFASVLDPLAHVRAAATEESRPMFGWRGPTDRIRGTDVVRAGTSGSSGVPRIGSSCAGEVVIRSASIR